MLIRPETPADIPAIYALTEAAFAPMSFSDGTEADCLTNLRNDGDLTLSLVVEDEGAIIAHVAFSKTQIDGVFDGWYGLGPVAVVKDRQQQGIGTRLINAGHAQLRDQGAKGVTLIGNPKVYGPMGFVSDGALTYRDLPAEIVQYIAFQDERPAGTLTFAPALEV